MNEQFHFDSIFLSQNLMGPNCVRIAQELTEHLPLKPGMRVLDLGCGMGLTSIYLAKQYGVTVYAVDLWIGATANYARFQEFGLEDSIVPIHADANELPFADGYFDAVISVDAYHYFGTPENFLDDTLAPLVKPGGFIAVAVPGLKAELKNGFVPQALKPYWSDDMNFHCAAWWNTLWSRAEKVKHVSAYSMQSHKKAWEDWLFCDNLYAKGDVEMMNAENGQYFDTIGITCTVK